MNAIDSLLIDAALSQLSESPTSGAYSSRYLERRAVKHMFGAYGLLTADAALRDEKQ